MSSREPSLLARALEPLVSSLWILFLIWTALVALVWTTGFGEVELGERITNPDLRAALALFLKILDPAWVTLGAANIYLGLAASEGLGVVRRWALIVIVGVGLVAGASVLTGWPPR